MKPIRSNYIAIIAAAIIMTQNNGWGATALRPDCARVNTFYKYLAENNQIVITAQFSILKHLNQQVFGGKNSRSEVVISLLHALFQQQIRAQLLGDTSNINIVSSDAPNIKYIQMTGQCKYDCSVNMLEVVRAARRFAVEKAAAFLESGDRSIISGYFGRFILPDGRTKLTLPDKQEIQKINRLLQNYYGGAQRVQHMLGKSYTTGLGQTSQDSLFGAKLAAAEPELHHGVVEFDISEFMFQLELAISQKAQLSWLFAHQEPKGLLNIMSLIRSNQHEYDVKSTSKHYQYMIANSRGLDISNTSSLQQIHTNIRRYTKRIKIFGYLPSHLIPVDSNARQQFNSLNNPTVIGHTDVMGLGAHALLSAHQHIEELYSKTHQLVEQVGGGLDSDVNKVKGLYQSLQETRSNIFLSTNQYLSKTVDELKQTFRSQGLGDSKFKIFTLGDDSFFVINSKRVTAESIALAIKSNPALKLRTITRNLPSGTARVNDHNVRLDLGAATEVIKAMEDIAPSEEVAGIYRDGNSRTLRVMRLDKQNRRFTTIDQQALREAQLILPKWKLE